jgi:tRNA(Ile)-lysidine synthase
VVDRTAWIGRIVSTQVLRRRTVSAWSRLVERVPRCLHALPESRRGLVIAVSGGADSTALLRAVHEAEPSAPLVAAHLHHGLRGAESDADLAFVEALCAALGVRLRALRLDVAAEARAAGENVEGTARRLRYRWLTDVARECGAAWVATGHNADDQAETVLHRLLRGAGLQGLRGIAERRPLEDGVGVVRPLLRVSAAEVRAALREQGWDWREDSSNVDLKYTRNRIRRELLPHLTQHYNPGVAAALARLAEQAEEAFQAEEAEAATLLRAAELPRAGRLLILSAEPLTAAPSRMVRALLRLLWEREDWPRGDMDHDAWQRAAEVARGGAQAVDLPGGVQIRRRERVVQLGRGA